MKDRIITAAEKRFFRDGLRRVTMDQIASDLGISKKTLYKHFQSKDELARAVVYRFQKGIVSLLERMKTMIPDPIERFEKLVIEVSQRRSTISNRFPADIKTDIPDLWSEIQDFRERQTLQYMGDILKEGVERGKIREDINTDIATRIYLGAVEMLMRPDVLAENRFSVEEAFANISRIFMEGVRVERNWDR